MGNRERERERERERATHTGHTLFVMAFAMHRNRQEFVLVTYAMTSIVGSNCLSSLSTFYSCGIVTYSPMVNATKIRGQSDVWIKTMLRILEVQKLIRIRDPSTVNFQCVSIWSVSYSLKKIQILTVF